MDVDLRKLRYFVAVAQTASMRAAADQLFVAQPVLTRQLRALEQELGVRLLDRSHLGTTLTPAGEQVLEDALPLLRAADALERRASRAREDRRLLTIGFMPGLMVTAMVSRFCDTHPGWDADVVRTSFIDQVTVLHEGTADVAFVRYPLDEAGLVVTPLAEEPRVVALRHDHPYADHERIDVRELQDEPLLDSPDLVPGWAGDFLPTSRPGVTTRSMEEKLEHVAARRGIAIVGASVAGMYPRPEVVYRPLDGVPDARVGLASVAYRTAPEIAAFRRIALEVAVPTLGGSFRAWRASTDARPAEHEPAEAPDTRQVSPGLGRS
ncbi:LysR family transcriptional regulator [Xylanimonas allomyrinae]|uniref:LysR family transcriptional regulator n=1 Tax=Xylanimonas allomyrinae TaxID=2509459 RepID=A0A4P6EM80_9MICO|nr:LysR substrate-binding domain-containing protein [Xylanimonas allomyrinae]QAY63950.1 LysR family transcriptional regulator [Xylanimonas allomyrinae]